MALRRSEPVAAPPKPRIATPCGEPLRTIKTVQNRQGLDVMHRSWRRQRMSWPSALRTNMFIPMDFDNGRTWCTGHRGSADLRKPLTSPGTSTRRTSVPNDVSDAYAGRNYAFIFSGDLHFRCVLRDTVVFIATLAGERGASLGLRFYLNVGGSLIRCI
jgi:hypothetical protein